MKRRKKEKKREKKNERKSMRRFIPSGDAYANFDGSKINNLWYGTFEREIYINICSLIYVEGRQEKNA